jgi:hypothetical protein
MSDSSITWFVNSNNPIRKMTVSRAAPADEGEGSDGPPEWMHPPSA